MPQARTGRRRWRDNPAAPQKIPAALVTLLVSRGLDFESNCEKDHYAIGLRDGACGRAQVTLFARSPW